MRPYDLIGNRFYQYLTNAGGGNTPILDLINLGVGGTRDYTWGAAGRYAEATGSARDGSAAPVLLLRENMVPLQEILYDVGDAELSSSDCLTVPLRAGRWVVRRGRPVFDGLDAVLRDLRIERGLTQAELAGRAGVSKSMLSLYERGKQRPQLDTLERLLDALDVGLADLVTRLQASPSGHIPAGRRGPRRAAPRGPAPRRLQEETVEAATEVLQGIAALLRYAIHGEPPGAEQASGEASRGGAEGA